MSLFQPNQGEKILIQSAVVWFSSKLSACPGVFYVTDRRVVFEKPITPGSNVISLWLVKSFRARIVADVPFQDLKKVRITKMLLGSNRKLHFEYGENTLTIQSDNWEDIMALLPNTVQVVEE
jgi:hypothetical protein